jgi:adenylate cyclase
MPRARLQRTPAANPDAVDLALQCSAGSYKAGGIGKEADAAYSLCDQALAIDPNNVRALTELGVKFWLPAVLGLSSDTKRDLERADDLESKALALKPDEVLAHTRKGWVALAQGRNDEAVADFERARTLDPSNPDGEAGLGWVHLRLGEFDKSVGYLDKAIRLSPYDRAAPYWYGAEAQASFGLKHYDRAIEQLRQVIAINPNDIPWAHTMLVAALALAGRDAEAHEALQRYLAQPSSGPLKTIAAWKAHDESQHWLPAEVSERVYDGLRNAGMPEK